MKYTKLERNWVMYDVGNSALVLLNTSVVPIYFNAINTGASSADLVVAWGNAQTIASLVIAMLMPILGALADYAGNKIKFFLGFFLTGLVLCLAQAIPMSAMAFLTVYVLCTIGLNSSMTFYDAMLPDITTDERMDAVSSSGYAWGYIGSTVPFVICLALIMGGPALGVPTMLATRLSFVITGAWWLIFTLPLIRTYKQKYGRERGPEDTIGHIVGGVFSEVGHTMREIAHNKTVLVYMIAFFFYIDGVHTVISMATSYGSALGIDSPQLVLALLVTQFVAFPSAIIYGKLAGRVGTLNMILVAVAAYMGIVLFAGPLTDWLACMLPRLLSAPLAMTIAAQSLTLPIQVLMDPQLPLASVPANLLVGPVVGFATMAGLVALFISWLMPQCGYVLAWIAGCGTSVMERVAAMVSDNEFATMPWAGGIPGALLMVLVESACATVLILATRWLRLLRSDGSGDGGGQSFRPRLCDRIRIWWSQTVTMFDGDTDGGDRPVPHTKVTAGAIPVASMTGAHDGSCPAVWEDGDHGKQGRLASPVHHRVRR